MLAPLGWRPPMLTTERLVLRAFVEGDIEPLFAVASNPNVTRYTLWEAHQTIEDTVLFIRDYALNRYREGTPEPYALVLRSGPNHPIGAIGCFWASRPNFTMELGYWLAEPYWGQGLVCEAIRVLVDYVVPEFGVQRLQARVIAGNSASARVLEKCGFEYEGTLRSSQFRRGKFEDVLMFSRVNAITPANAPG